MGLFDRLLRRTADEKSEQGTETATPPCPHTALGPRWDSADDIGIESKANSFRCEACEQTFTREEAVHIRAEEAERLKAMLSRND